MKAWHIFAISVAVILFGNLIYFGPDLSRHFGKRYADAERDIHQQSLSYQRGMVENLQRHAALFALIAETAKRRDDHRRDLKQDRGDNDGADDLNRGWS